MEVGYVVFHIIIASRLGFSFNTFYLFNEADNPGVELSQPTISMLFSLFDLSKASTAILC